MTDPRLNELIQADIDGELDAQQRAELARRLLADPAARAERDELRRVCTSLDAIPQVEPPPDLRDNVLAALPHSRPLTRTARAAARDAWVSTHRWRYAALLAGVAAAGAVVFQTVRGPGPAGTEAAGTMVTGVLDRAQLDGPVSGTVALYRDGTGLGLRFDLAASGPVRVVIVNDGQTLPLEDAAEPSAAGLHRTVPLSGITAHGQPLGLTFLLAGRPAGSTQLRLPEGP
jgi:hypothetical protein